jgi:hypothetical protein
VALDYQAVGQPVLHLRPGAALELAHPAVVLEPGELVASPAVAALVEAVRQAGEHLGVALAPLAAALEQAGRQAAADLAPLAVVLAAHQAASAQAAHQAAVSRGLAQWAEPGPGRWYPAARQAAAAVAHQAAAAARPAAVVELERQEEDCCLAGAARSGLAGVLFPRQWLEPRDLCPCRRCRGPARPA